MTGTLYVTLDISGPAVDPNAVGPFTVQPPLSMSGPICVPPASLLGGGTFTSTIKVHACLNSSTCASGELAGSPQTLTVTYSIGGDPIVSAVMPHVAVAGTAGNLVLSGSGFTGTSAVSIGSTQATSFAVSDDVRTAVTYPASLIAGTLPIALTGSVRPFNGSLVVVNPQTYAAAALSYPQQPDHVLATVWDAERQNLYVAAAFAQSANNVVWRYAYNGSWSAPQTFSIPDLRDLVLSNDGSKLVALTSTAVREYDAANPSTPTRSIAAPFTNGGMTGSPILLRFAFANDGNAVVATGLAGTAAMTDAYLYMPVSGTFFDLGSSSQLQSTAAGVGAGLVASANGSVVMVSQNSAGASPIEMLYNGETEWLSATNFDVPQVLDEPGAIDAAGQWIGLNNGTNAEFIFVNGAPLFTLYINGTQLLVVIINPQGTRAFVLESDGKLHSYDLTATNGLLNEVGTGLALAPPSVQSTTLRTAVTPDGATLFIAGDGGVAIVPAPN